MEFINRRKIPVFNFIVCDIIILNRRNITIIKPNSSLNYKDLGLYKVIKVINNTVFKLRLLETLEKVIPVFYL